MPDQDETETNPCHQWIDELIALADHARLLASVEARRRRLACELVYRYVPPVRMFGLDVRGCIAGADWMRNRSGEGRPPSGVGFKRALTRGGQDAEVVRHVASAAACVLRKREVLIMAATLMDRLQGIFRHSPEAGAEIAGNRAGAAAGRLLTDYLDERVSADELRIQLRELLCGGKQSDLSGVT